MTYISAEAVYVPYLNWQTLANIACQTLLFVSESLVNDNNVMVDLGLKQLTFRIGKRYLFIFITRV